MRTLRLAGVAAQAERLRLRRMARRLAIRAALGGVAVLLLLLAVVGAHAALIAHLAWDMPLEHALLWVAAGDLLIGLLIAWLALRRSHPGTTEREARAVRDAALAPLCDMVSAGRLVLRAEGLWLRAALLLLQFLNRAKGR